MALSHLRPLRGRTLAVLAAVAVLSGGAARALVHPNGGGGGGPITQANLWVDTSGGTCTRSSSPAAYSDAAACGSLDAAYQAASCDDTVLVKGGTYGSGDVFYDAGKTTCTSSTRVKLNVASGETVTTPGIAADGAQHLYVSGEQGAWTMTGNTDGIDVIASSGIWNSCGAPFKSARDVVFDHITAHEFTVICNVVPDDGNFDHITVQNSDLGNTNSCNGQEDIGNLTHTDTITFKNNWIHDLTQTGCSGPHSDCVQLQGDNTNTVFDGNVWANCFDDGLFIKGDFGNINGVTVQNDTYGAGSGGLTDKAIAAGCNAGTNSDIIVRNVTVKDTAIGAGGCGNVPNCRFTSNLLGTGADISTGNGSNCTVDYNAYLASGPSTIDPSDPFLVAGTNATYNAVPNWVSPTGTPPDFHIGAGSSGIIGTGSPNAGDFAPLDLDGTSRPLGAVSDAGADEKG